MKFERTAAGSVKYPLFDLSKIKVAQGGYSIDTSILPTGLDYVKKGTLITIADATRLAQPFKTTTVITGGSTSAPRVTKNNLFKVADVVQVDGRDISRTISAIDTTTSDDYDVWTLSGAITGLVAGDVLIQGFVAALGAGYGGGVKDIAADEPYTITVFDPQFLGAEIVLKVAAGDTLAITYAAKVLTIAMANTTGSKNATATIQTALQALAVIEGVNFATATVTGTVTPGTGQVLTTKNATAVLNNSYGYKRTPNAIVLETVKYEGTPTITAVIAAMEIEDDNLPYPITAGVKAALGSNFHFKA